MLDCRLTQEFLNLIFYIKDDELFWKERKQEDFVRSVDYFNEKYADNVAGLVDAYGTRKVGITLSKGVYFKGVDIEGIKHKMLTGDDLVREFISDHPYFNVWSGIRGRCGVKKDYLDVKLSEDFNAFEKFLSWAEKQKGFMQFDGSGNIFEIDKDILCGGSGKVYSPDTCVFVPRVLNLMAYRKRRTTLPKGVQYFKGRKKPYRAYMSNNDKLNHYGYYYTVEDAAKVVREARFEYLKSLEDQYKDVVDDRVFPAIYKLHESW